MDKKLADALLQFYQQILKPEFDAIKIKLAEHDERFDVMTGHLDAIYHKLGTLEDEYLMTNSRLKRIEDQLAAGNLSRAGLENQVQQIKDQLIDLQNRLETVERQLNL